MRSRWGSTRETQHRQTEPILTVTFPSSAVEKPFFQARYLSVLVRITRTHQLYSSWCWFSSSISDPLVLCSSMHGQVWRTKGAALSLFSTFALSLAESSVGWQLSLSASDVIVPGRIWGLNQKSRQKRTPYETDLHETPGDSHYSAAAYQDAESKKYPPPGGQSGSRLRWGCRLQEEEEETLSGQKWLIISRYCQMLRLCSLQDFLHIIL